MLRYFRDNTVRGGFALSGAILLLWVGQWLAPVPPRTDPTTHSLLSQWLFTALAAWHTHAWVYQLSGNVLLLAIAWLLNNLHNRYKLATNANRLTAYFVVLISAVFPAFTVLSPTLIATFFITLAMQRLWVLYYETSPRVWLLDVGFLMGTAVLIHPSTLLLVPWIVGSVILLRPFRITDLAALMIGLLIPLFWLTVYLLWVDNLSLLPALFYDIGIPYSIEFAFTYVDWAKVMLVALIAILFLIRNLSALFTYTIQVRRYIRITIAFFPLALIAIVTNIYIYVDHFLLLLPPLALLFGFHYADVAHQRWATALHMALFWLVILSQYLTFVV